MGKRFYSAWDERLTVTTNTVDPHSGSLLCEVMGPQVGHGLIKATGCNGLDPVPLHAFIWIQRARPGSEAYLA